MLGQDVLENIGRSVDLSSFEINSLRIAVLPLAGSWSTRVRHSFREISRSSWMYAFRSGPASDASPTLGVFRIPEGYMMITWDFLSLCDNSTWDVQFFDTIEDLKASLRIVLSEVVDCEDHSDYPWPSAGHDSACGVISLQIYGRIS